MKDARSTRRWIALPALALGLLGLAAGTRTPAALAQALAQEQTQQQPAAQAAQEKPAAGREVVIDNFTFAPAKVEVAVGTTVTWVNHDDMPHTVVSPDKVFRSPTLDSNEKFSYLFAKAGTYAYFCSLHPKMTGQVVVR